MGSGARGGPQARWVPTHAGLSWSVPSRFSSTLGSTSPGPCKAKCRAAGKAPREHTGNLRWHSSRGRITGCPSSGHSTGTARKGTRAHHILGAQVRATCPTQGVRPAWLSGSLTRRAGAGRGSGESGHPRAPGASLLTWQDALKKNT